MKIERVFDVLGLTVSSLCAIHCISLPLFMMLFPFIGLSFVNSHLIENVFVLFALVSGLAAHPSSFRTHRVKIPILIFLIGISMIVSAEMFAVEHNRIVVISGAFIVGFSHVLNFYYTKTCKKC